MSERGPEEERRLVARLKRHEERAFNELIREFQVPVFNLVARMLGRQREDALDVSQEVFVTVFKSIEGFRGESRLSTWIYRIAVNHCRNRIKYHGRRRSVRHETLDEMLLGEDQLGSEVSDNQPTRPDRELVARQTETFLKEAIAALDDEQREILVLRDVQGLTYEEIVLVTGHPEGTVKSRLHRARTTLQRALERFQRGDPVFRRRTGG